MKVLKAINNNVVSCVDSSGRELVVMGRGLGFRSKPGDVLTADMVEKVFRMTSHEEVTRFKDLLSRLPAELLELCSQIIDHANHVLGRRLSESIYLTLTDHVHFALERARGGMVLHNALMTEVRVFYPGEFAVGKYALGLISQQQGITLPEDEAASIALHLVNAEYNSSMNATMHVAQALKPMVNIITGWKALHLNQKHLYYDELIVHLKFLAMQAFSGTQEHWHVPDFVENLKDRLPEAFACAEAVIAYLSEQCGQAIPHEEMAYLAICIHRACIS